MCCVLPFCRTEHQMVTMSTQMTVKTKSARTPPITAYGTALWVSTTAPGSEGTKKTHTLTRVWRGRADGLRGMGNKSKENIIVKITPQGADQRWKTAFNFQYEGERTWEKEGVSVFHLTSIITVAQLCDAQEEKGAEMRTGCKKPLKNQKQIRPF